MRLTPINGIYPQSPRTLSLHTFSHLDALLTTFQYKKNTAYPLIPYVISKSIGLKRYIMNGYWQSYLQNAFRTKIRAFHQAFLKPRTALYLKVKSISVLSCIAFVPVNNVDSTSV